MSRVPSCNLENKVSLKDALGVGGLDKEERTQAHWPDEALKLGVSPREIGSDKGWEIDLPLPSLLLRLAAGLDDREHGLLADTRDLW